MTQYSEYYLAGYDDYMDGYYDNPFIFGTSAYSAYLNGSLDAEYDMDYYLDSMLYHMPNRM